MKHINIDKGYLLLKKWWESVDLTNYEKSNLNKEIISFNQQLFRLKEKHLRIGIYGKSGVGKSYILNLLLNKNEFKTDIINGSTKNIEGKEWVLKHQGLKTIELIDSPGFDFCDIKDPDYIFSQINYSELILFTISGDINRNEVSQINSFIKNGKKIILVLNKIDIWNNRDLRNILKNIRLKLPKNINIPIILNSKNNLKNQITDLIQRYGESLLTINCLQLADELFLKIKEQRLQRRKREAQSIIGKFATIKASGVALNPLVLIDIAGGFALDTALVSELSKVYGLNLKSESARNIIKKISVNNVFLGITQVSINTSFNILRKVFLATAPFTHGLSLLPYGPVAIVQALISVRSTKVVGKLAAKEILKKSKVCLLDPSHIIKKIIMKEPEIFDHTKVYLSNKNSNNNLSIFLP
ncbi:GTP-binding protein [Prochlorococcus sp. AH-716-K03]|nr:GTP-binding protein [Prochlorococcus sp. AH-716-K03]